MNLMNRVVGLAVAMIIASAALLYFRTSVDAGNTPPGAESFASAAPSSALGNARASLINSKSATDAVVTERPTEIATAMRLVTMEPVSAERSQRSWLHPRLHPDNHSTIVEFWIPESFASQITIGNHHWTTTDGRGTCAVIKVRKKSAS